MREFIDEFGKDNFMIIFWVIVVVVAALIIIILVEKIQARSKLKNTINREIENCDRLKNDKVKTESYKLENEVSINNDYDDYDILEDEVPVKEEIVYVKAEPTKEEAKEKLEEVTKKLIEDDNNLIDHTYFETEQEEKSIISYEELLRASHDIDEKNDRLLEDEGEAAITLDELYMKHLDEQDKLEEESLKGKVSNPVFVHDDEKKFKNSEVISPVFGFYSGKVKQEIDNEEFLETFDSEDKPKDIEAEIEKTEEFLSELKRLKNKLD